MRSVGGLGLASVLTLLISVNMVRGVPDAMAEGDNVQVMNVGAESVIWVAQLSDLHFSVHHPDRALDFATIMGPMLRIIQPALVFITGDLVEAKSKDLLVMKQNENEWMEYRSAMEDVVQSSGLDRNVFYDMRGNHDNFGVPGVGGSFDFYSKYGINWALGRTDNVQSVTVETDDRKHLFVAVDTTMSSGVRGPTNLLGHPTDELLSTLDARLSQWDSVPEKPVTKVAFGHFTLSFSAFSESGKSLKDVFLKQKLSAYSCGHLHTKFGKNLKRHHQASLNSPYYQDVFQLNIHQESIGSTKNCSMEAAAVEEFWEWEMGDWRKSRAMRLMAIDKGLVSFVDVDFKNGWKQTIILPTFPLDSRFMSTSSLYHLYECQYMVPSSFETIRALVFSSSSVASVVARVFDSKVGMLENVLEEKMAKAPGYTSRGNIYEAPWNYRAFEDTDPLRFWLQIEVVDTDGLSTVSELRPFSINGLSAKIRWTWLEFKVMGCQWASLYYPAFWCFMCTTLTVLLLPRIVFALSKAQFTYKSFMATKKISHGVAWSLQELCHLPIPYYGFIGYILYILLFPLFSGRIYSDDESKGTMTYRGWVVWSREGKFKQVLGYPDVMVIIIPHLLFVLFPSIVVAWGLAAERSAYKECLLSYSSKKDDERLKSDKQGFLFEPKHGSKVLHCRRWMRKMLLITCVGIGWNHFQSCRRMITAYDMNLFVDSPVYNFTVPVLLAYTVYRTRLPADVK